MAIQIADNFKYQGKKPLDFRIQCKTITELVAMKTSTIYDGILVYVTDEQKYYTYDSKNDSDPTLKKWREFQGGLNGSSTVKEYTQGGTYTKDTLIVYDGKLYMVSKDFTSDTTGTTVKDSLDIDITSGNLTPVSMEDKDTHSYEYTVGENYKKDNLVVKDNKLYIVTKDITATDFDTEVSNKDLIIVTGETDTDTHAYKYVVGTEYKETELVIKDKKLYIVDSDFTATDFDTELNNGTLISVDTDMDTDTHSFEYTVGEQYKKGNLIVKDNKLYLVTTDYTSVDFDTEITNGELTPIDTNTDVDTHSYLYTIGDKYKKTDLVIKDFKLYMVMNDITATDFDTELSNGDISPVDTDVDTDTHTLPYQQNTSFKQYQLITYQSKLYLVQKDFTSDNTETNIEDSLQKDIGSNNLIEIVGNGSGDAKLTEDITSRVIVGNIKVGDIFKTGTTFTQFVKKLLLKEILPTGNIASDIAFGLKLKGSTVNTPTITANITSLGTCTIQTIEFYRAGVLEDTQTYTAGTNSYTYKTTDITTDTTYQIKIHYTESDGTTMGVLTYSGNYKFVNYSYFGVLDNIPTDTDVLTLTNTLKDTKGFTGTCSPTYQHIVYAYPSSLGNVTSIKDQNNFEYMSSYTKITLIINEESYNVYYLTDKVTASGFKQIYA